MVGRGPWGPCPGGHPCLNPVLPFLPQLPLPPHFFPPLLPPPPLPLLPYTRLSCSSQELLGPGCFLKLPRPLLPSLYNGGGGPRGLLRFLQHQGSGVWSGLTPGGSGPPPQPLSTENHQPPRKPQEPSPEPCPEALPCGVWPLPGPCTFYLYMRKSFVPGDS